MDLSAELSVTQQFDLERMNRAIDATTDREQLQRIAKRLLHAWQSQRAATDWVLHHHDERP